MSAERARQVINYPTRAAVLIMAAGAPLSLGLGAMAPGLWLIGVAWIVGVAALILIDALMNAKASELTLSLVAPATMSINGVGEAILSVAFAHRAPGGIEVALEADPKLTILAVRTALPVRDQRADVRLGLTPVRRGEAVLTETWTRWRGPLGLIWRQVSEAPGQRVVITPDIAGVTQDAVRLFSRQALHGLKMQLDTGEGADFHALREFQPGMDTRAIDWKQSARHGQLLAKEFRTERNNPIILAVDGGRTMCEPIGALARVDWALNAALLLAYVSLKLGDRAGLYSFDERPRGLSGPVAGVRAFTVLQHAAARIDYSVAETNYTLGLASLADRLDRRSLIVVFTEFADQTSAELMIENIGRLLRRHLVIFVAMRDEELEALVRAEPVSADDVTRAVIAQSLLRERELVTTRLRRMGVEIVDAPARAIGPTLLSRYVELKRRSRL